MTLTKFYKPITEFTFDTLVDTLIAGEGISIDITGEVFQLSKESCIALAFYRRDPKYWGKFNVTSNEIKSLLEALKTGKISRRTHSPVTTSKSHQWRLKRVVAHRFAGLHRHCNSNDGSPPPKFEWEVEKPLSLIWGFNGAGKSSLLSAITWCLTGRALRSHKMPESVHEPMTLEMPPKTTDDFMQKIDDLEQCAETFSLPPVVPVPSVNELEALNNHPITDDTWVELFFEDIAGNKIVKVRRELSQTRSGAYRTNIIGVEDLGLTDLALQVGTLMPSIASQMRFDEPTELGTAVAELTGMKPFAEFGKRCPKIIDRLTNREVVEAKKRQEDIIAKFHEKREYYRDNVASHPSLIALNDLVLPGTSVEPDCHSRLTAAKLLASKATETAKSCFQSITGKSITFDDTAKVDALIVSIDNAKRVLTPAELKLLPTAQGQLTPLRNSSEQTDDIEITENLIATIFFEAHELADRLQEAEKAERWLLYARVALWQEHHHPERSFENCPICTTPLSNVPQDFILNIDVSEALEKSRRSAAHMMKTVKEWEQDKSVSFKSNLPKSILDIIDLDWSNGLPFLYNKVIFEELLTKSEIKNSFSFIVDNVCSTWKSIHDILPNWTMPKAPQLPAIFDPKCNLQNILEKATIAISIARFRNEHQEAFSSIISTLIGRESIDRDIAIDIEHITRLPFINQLQALRQTAAAARPAAKAIEILDDLFQQFKLWQVESDHLIALRQAATAIKPFSRFPQLVEDQVTGLLSDLAKGTETWTQRVYRPHYPDGPGFLGFGADNGKILNLQATLGGTVAPAHQVLNSSALRAHVWGFLLALWERVWEQQGGLSCILLDDPQSLFDAINAENMAAAIPTMMKVGMFPIIVTNDNHFFYAVSTYIHAQNQSPNSSFLQISPISLSKLVASVVTKAEELRDRRNKWREDRVDVDKARAFVEPVRANIETRLWDLLASDPKTLFKPTLADLISKISNARSSGQKPFNEEPFDRLVRHESLQPSCDFYKAINKAHHRPRDITPNDAEVVDHYLKAVEELIDACASSYARFLGRLPNDRYSAVPTNLPATPSCNTLPSLDLNILPPFPANMGYYPVLDFNNVVETWNISELGNVSLFGIGAYTLGAACLSGQTVIADVTAEPKRGDLVICQNGEKFYARRLGIDREDPARLILETIPSSTHQLPPTHILPRHSSRIIKIIGVLFDQHGKISGEAVSISISEALRSVRAVAPVVGMSAYPIAPEGSRILLNPINIINNSDVDSLEGCIVAVVTSVSQDTPRECVGYLKRLGPSVPGFSAVRVLQNIGLQGESIYVHFPSLGSSPSTRVPAVTHIWKMCGVIYSR